MTKPTQPRGGTTLTEHKIGDVQVRISIGHLDQMPVCQRCGKALCQHSDAEFSGVIPA